MSRIPDVDVNINDRNPLEQRNICYRATDALAMSWELRGHRYDPMGQPINFGSTTVYMRNPKQSGH